MRPTGWTPARVCSSSTVRACSTPARAVDVIAFTHPHFLGASNLYRRHHGAEVWIHALDAENPLARSFTFDRRFERDFEETGLEALHLGGTRPASPFISTGTPCSCATWFSWRMGAPASTPTDRTNPPAKLAHGFGRRWPTGSCRGFVDGTMWRISASGGIDSGAYCTPRRPSDTMMRNPDPECQDALGRAGCRGASNTELMSTDEIFPGYRR